MRPVAIARVGYAGPMRPVVRVMLLVLGLVATVGGVARCCQAVGLPSVRPHGSALDRPDTPWWALGLAWTGLLVTVAACLGPGRPARR